MTFLVDEGREDPLYHYKWTSIGPSAKRHLNWRANDDPTLNNGLVAL